MRAGDHAELEGATYRCSDPHAPVLTLLADGSEPAPPGFERNRWGEWSRTVDRPDLTRLTTVRSVAVWRGLRVRVTRVLPATQQAVVEHRSWPPPDAPDVWTVENGVWQARVPVGDLTEVVEETFDIAI